MSVYKPKLAFHTMYLEYLQTVLNILTSQLPSKNTFFFISLLYIWLALFIQHSGMVGSLTDKIRLFFFCFLF